MGKPAIKSMTKPQINFSPKTQQQSELFHQLKKNNLLIALGPAGTGKTFTVVTQAAIWLVGGHIDRVVLARANVPTGKSLGAIPGTLEEKLEPWVMPMTDVLRNQMGRAYYEHAVSKGKIETVALETIRGRSFDNAMILIDEAQQLTMEEIKAITTRIGEGSVLVLMGDPKQTDRQGSTGLVGFSHMLAAHDIDKTCVVEFDLDDIVRSDTCANMVKMFYKEGLCLRVKVVKLRWLVRKLVSVKRNLELPVPKKSAPKKATKKSGATPTNKALYARVKAEAKRKYKVWPSAYASGWLTKEYKKRGGTYK